MMFRTLRRLALVVTAALTLTVTGALPATAITGGEPDGNRHPNVGMIAFYDAADHLRYRCSATLISPTVLITAAHCTEGTAGVTLVTFESVIAEEPPSPLPVAADPGSGYTAEELEAAGYLWGTPITHPEYSGFTDLANWNDVGIVRLGEPVTGITPATPAPLGYLDQYESPVLNGTIFELVGYGTEVRKPEAGPQKPQPMSYPLIRRYTTSPGQKLTPQILQLQGNPNDNRGGGGTCFGDSGGPVFLNGYLVAVTSYGYTSNCRYLGGYQRVDIPVVQDWLIPYL
ncbi:S1 family peptidase [Pseudarthrobacter sp. YS3]|uniref:S1 family peptidase n=1 Tax=Pseudarthrobacter sp. YS3 TaxID=3453718 RepID=UPI003EEBC0A2